MLNKYFGVQQNFIGAILFFTVFICLLLFTRIDLISIIFVCFIFSVLFWNIKAYISILISLICLISIVLLQIANSLEIILVNQLWPEVIANYIYYFLLIGFIKKILEMTWDKSTDEDDVPPVISVPTYFNDTDLLKPETLKNTFISKRIHDIPPPTKVSRKRI